MNHQDPNKLPIEADIHDQSVLATPKDFPVAEGGERADAGAPNIRGTEVTIPDAMHVVDGQPQALQAARTLNQTEVIAPVIEAPTSHKGRKAISLLAASATLVGLGYGASKVIGGGSADHKQTAATSTPTAGESHATSPSNTPSTSENTPTSIPNTVSPEQLVVVPDITDVSALPSGVPSQEVSYNGWKMQLPVKLADPEKNPKLFVQEIMMIDAVAMSVPADSPIFTECVRLYGKTDGGDDMSKALTVASKDFKQLGVIYSKDPPQEVYFHAPGVDLTTTLDKTTKTVTVTSTDGKSGIWFASDAFRNTPWQEKAAMIPGADQTVFPNGELKTYIVTYARNRAGDIVVTSIDTGTGVSNG